MSTQSALLLPLSKLSASSPVCQNATFIMIFKPSLVAAVAGFLSLASSHPGEKHDAVQEQRDAAMRHYLADANKRSLSACAGTDYVKARQERAMHRRLETFKRLRRERGLEERQSSHFFLHK
jgi:hypothetical protein